MLSDKPPKEGAKSHREWIANKGYADLETAIGSFRELESRFLAGDKLVVPKDGDAPEVVEAFHKAIGRPDSPDGYEVSAPEGQELDQELVGRMREAAFKNGVPKAAFEAMVAQFNEHALGMLASQSDAQILAKQQGVEALRKDWGTSFDANVAHANKAMSALELDADYVTRMEAGLGTADTMKLLSKIGIGISEDALIGGGTARFTMSLADAEAELADMKQGEKAKRLASGDKELLERRKQLLAVKAQHEATESKRLAQS